MKGEPPPADELLTTMTQRAQRFDPGKVTQNDLAKMGGAPAVDDA